MKKINFSNTDVKKAVLMGASVILMVASHFVNGKLDEDATRELIRDEVWKMPVVKRLSDPVADAKEVE